jgi:hypothetical protein
MLRLLPTPLGIALVFAGLSLITSVREAGLIFLAIGVVLGAIIAAAAVRRRRSGQSPLRTEAEELGYWRGFAARRRRSAPLESAFYLLILAGVFWLDGITVGALLIAAGFVLLLTSRWLIEPRTWAELTRRLTEPEA